MDIEFLKPLARTMAEAGGRLLVVGGRVREHFLPEPPKPVDLAPEGPNAAPPQPDWDLVAFGLPLPDVLRLAGTHGRARPVGRRTTLGRDKEAALVHLRLGDHLLEISPARRLAGAGAEFHPEAGPADDARVRDFTVNAVYHDPLTRAFEDPLGGLADLNRRRLRAAHPRSLDLDPLRLLRAFSFISRLGLTPDPELLTEAARRRDLLAALPPDRFWPEWRKWALGAEPGLGLDFLADSGLLAFWPALAAMDGSPQNPQHHPEGDVWRHTRLVVETLSRLDLSPPAGFDGLRDQWRPPDRLALILAALLHDTGKPVVTRRVDGIWISPGHAQAGLPLARDFLEFIRAPEQVVRPVLKLVERHMDLAFKDITTRALRRLARRLAPECTLTEAWALTVGDWNSRGPTLEPFPLTLAEFLEPLEGRASAPSPLIRGRDLLTAFPELTPGPQLGRLLKRIEEAADEGRVRTPEEALAWAGRLIKAAAESPAGSGPG